MQPQNSQDILGMLQSLGVNLAKNVPIPTIPTLGYTAPNVSDLDQKYQEFLTRASNDPDIVNYYNQLLQQAQGDTNIAKNFIEQDYQMGVRQITANLKGGLESLGLTFTQEQQNKQDELNKRGIALTQGDNGQTTYGGGGQSATELGQLGTSQRLRQEAEARTSSQKVEGMGLSRQKQLTGVGQQLQQTATTLGQNKQQDIANRAGTYYGVYQAKQSADAYKAAQNQQKNMALGGIDTEEKAMAAGFHNFEDYKKKMGL